jgi:uroporphyrinogen decarboxylase
MSYTPDFERVRKTLLRQGIPDRPPLMELWVDPAFKRAYLGRECITAQDELAFFLDMHMDYVPYHLNWGLALARLEKQAADSVYAFERAGQFDSLEDVKRFPWPKAEDYDLTLLHEINRNMPSGMKMIATGGYIFAEAWMLMGFANFAEATLLSPEIPAAIMNELGKFRYESFRRVIDDPALGAIWYDDDIAYGTGTMVTPDFLRANLFPWMKKIGDLCHERGIPFLYHSDGNLTEVVPDIIAAGVDALHPIEPGAMDASAIQARYGDKLSIVGHMTLDTIARGNFEDIEALVRDTLPRLSRNGGYAPGTSNTVPKWMPVENYLYFRDCVEKYGTAAK